MSTERLEPYADKVFAPYTACLGDNWALVSALCRMSAVLCNEVLLSTYSCAGAHMAPGVPPAGPNIRPLLDEIVDALDIGRAHVALLDVPGNVMLRYGCEDYRGEYLPTKRRWRPAKYNRICYQLTNNQLPENNSRCLRKPFYDHLMEWIGSFPGEKVRIGLPMSVKQCVDAAATSDLFIGMDSGMSHLCHSVGLPMFLCDWPALDRHHPDKRFIRFSSYDEAVAKMTALLASEPSEKWWVS